MRARSILILTGILAAIFIMVTCQRNDANEKTSENTSTEFVYLNHNDTVDYVGINTCRQCHSDIHKTFVHTGMGSSFGAADTTKSIAEIHAASILYDKKLNLSYKPFWKNDSLYILEFRTENGDTTYKNQKRIDYVVGSGQHTNSHMYLQNGYLFQAPFTWYSQQGKLDLPPGFEEGHNKRFGRTIGLECTSCHNAMPLKFVLGSENKYEEVPGAIDCERCHGPGELHVKRIQQGIVVDTSTQRDPSIVNPRKLTADLQFDLCQRCHLQGNAVLKPGKDFFDFRPGMKLSDVMDIYLPKYSNADDQFIMASHVDRLKQSKCYINSEGFNCISCHNPHVSVRETRIDKFNITCQNCHQGSPKHECTEEESKLKAADYNCVSCHMPPSSSIDIPHVTVHDHYIRKPEAKKETSGTQEFVGLFAINNAKPDNQSKARAYLQQYERHKSDPQYLDSAYHFLNLNNAFEDWPLWVYFYYLAQDYKALAEYVTYVGEDKIFEALNKHDYMNRDAWTSFRIAEGIFKGRNPAVALRFYNKAVSLAPFMPDFRVKYADALVANSQTEMAIDEYSKVVKQLPDHKVAHNNLAYQYLRNGNLPLAAYHLKKALQADPDYELALLNKVTLAMMQEDRETAVLTLSRILKINPNNGKAREALQQLTR